MVRDELTTTVFGAVESLPPSRKAHLLLETALSLIEAGQYGDEVENYLDVYLRTPGLAKGDIARALLARGTARKASGERLLAKAQQDLQAVAKLEPSNRQVQAYLRRGNMLSNWEHIAHYIPRYHLRAWFFVSTFHRSIASHMIFRTLDLYFGEDQDNLNRGLDILDRVKADPAFANQVKTLRLHWAYEEGDMLDLMTRLFRTALPALKALHGAEMVQAVLGSHPHLESLGLIGWHFDAVGVSAFRNLRKFVLRAEDDDGFADMGEVRTVLDQNEATLRHLTLGAYLQRTHSWDSAFQSTTVQNLTHLDLVDTRISHVVLARIAHAHNLQSLTLHGTCDEPASARVVFGADHVLDGRHTFLPHLVAFRFVMVGHDDDVGLFQAVAQFVRQRPQLRRLDLGSCPWELVRGVLPTLPGLRVLRVRIAHLLRADVDALTHAIPAALAALHITTVMSDLPMVRPAPTCSYLVSRRPQPNLLSEKDFKVQTDAWVSSARSIALALPPLDFVGWHGEHYVVVRGVHDGGKPRVELKELPVRRRLDCGNGVDLGGEDAAWVERKDVPMDYEMPGLEA
ncbi:hypothetical protein B0H21DRAFT_781435 [Amylocystis lapponica]|nr:hypothetical protein B0H21DRAFT_781435 [Amylocystis lapponica]